LEVFRLFTDNFVATVVVIFQIWQYKTYKFCFYLCMKLDHTYATNVPYSITRLLRVFICVFAQNSVNR